MAKISFPDLTPDYPLRESFEDNLIKSSMENGTVKTRPRFTKARKSYELSWALLHEDDKNELESFYLSKTKCGSLPFSWMHPSSERSILVRFEEPPTFTLVHTAYWQVSIKLQEV